MTRKNAREYAVQLVYTLGFTDDAPGDLLDTALSPDAFARLEGEDALYAKPPDADQAAYIRRLVCGVAEHQPELDSYIERFAVGWRFGRIPRVAVSIMRVCMYEVLYTHDVPYRAAMNEAVEIAKKYEPHEVVSFINGILGSFFRNEAPQ
ncbi:MAG: transcription antitermination factor NusB [Oscillospiraceae bacterium]|nr:transcription antitermination factor NusB [Oscillospiraceae bacterium]